MKAPLQRSASRAARIAAVFLAGALALPGVAGAQIAVLGSTLDEHTSKPGEAHTGVITVANESDDEQNVMIYQTDYMFFADGRSPFDKAGTNPRSNAAWVTLSATTIRMAPHSRSVVTYRVAVPDDTSLAGTYWSAVIVEPMRDVRGVSGRNTVGVGSTIRYAVQVASHVTATGSHSIEFSNMRLGTDTSGVPMLEVDVENDGERAYRPLLWLEVYDAEGTLRAKVRQQRGLLYPGTSLRQRFQIGALGAGAYKALLYADSGDESVFATEFRLEL